MAKIAHHVTQWVAGSVFNRHTAITNNIRYMYSVDEKIREHLKKKVKSQNCFTTEHIVHLANFLHLFLWVFQCLAWHFLKKMINKRRVTEQACET